MGGRAGVIFVRNGLGDCPFLGRLCYLALLLQGSQEDIIHKWNHGSSLIFCQFYVFNNHGVVYSVGPALLIILIQEVWPRLHALRHNLLKPAVEHIAI